MKKFIFISIFALCTLHNVLSQQYGWVDLTANLPDTTLFGGLKNVVFIGEHGWITQKWRTLPRRIFYTSDGGQTFTTHYLPDDAGIIGGIFMRSATEGYIVTYWDSLDNTGNIFHSTDARNGVWTLQNQVSGAGLSSICFPPFPDTIGYICDAGGDVYKLIGDSVAYDDHLTHNWLTEIDSPVTSNDVWTIGGTTLRHRDSTGWKIDQNYASDVDYTSICFVDNYNGWACGDLERIIHTTDGHNWINQSGHEMGKTLNDIDFCDLQNGWTVGIGLIFHSTNGGNQWISESGNFNLDEMHLYGVSVPNTQTAYAVGDRKGTLGPVFLKYMQILEVAEKEGAGIAVFPNPVGDKFAIRILQPAAAKVELVDVSGKVVIKLFEGELGPDKIEFDVSQLPAGVYLIKIIGDNSTVTKKVIKLN